MSVSGSILVFLANGIQGSAVVRAARDRGHPVRALVRDPRAAAALPASDLVQGDLDDPASLAAAMNGVAHLVLQVPTGAQATMERQVGNVLRAAERSHIRSIVLKLASASRSAPCDEPSFVANAALERRLHDSGIPFARVRPTLYLDNLLKPSARAEIVAKGLFAPPIAAGQRIAWTCADDCARASILLIEQGRYGGDHRIAGPESVTGHELAARLSAGWGRTIAYRAQPIPDFEREIDAAMGAGMGRRVASKFRYLADHPEDADRILAAPHRPSPDLPGFAPTAIQDWARRHAGRFG
ncbi:NmrA family NAD(P)-binding protein [Methylobacterium organophilum]|uniref:SDR family oxidoreductase n=1 Tax=Methylobacterium organophilum TaxID=410 RepID=UPI001F13F2FC|nr:NmrA family NAD(P)-binding protein [Methylobacterium organophilum]UMY19776.1 NmrA family NAD(P)-binding protein [Methylobacterium organophilum]